MIAVLFFISFQGAMALQQQQNNTAQNATGIKWDIIVKEWDYFVEQSANSFNQTHFVEQSASFFQHPAVVLGSTIIVTVFMIPYFTNKWQKHQKGLEIKVDLLQRISKNVMEIMTLIESLSEPYDDDKLELDKEIRKFKVDNKAIGTELEGYYPSKDPIKKDSSEPDENMRVAWDKLRRDILVYYEKCEKYAKENCNDEAEQQNKKTIEEIIHDKGCIIDGVDLREMHCCIIQKKHRIIWFMLDGPIPDFSLWPGFIVCSRLYKRWKFRDYRHKAKGDDALKKLVRDCLEELENYHK